MGKFIDIAKAYEMSNKKLEELKKKIALTDEQIKIIYAIASARSMYNFEMGSMDASHIRSVKVDAIKKCLDIFGFEGDFFEVENLMVMIYTNEVYEEFSVYEDTFVYSDLYIGETADADIGRMRTRFVIVDNGDMVYKLDEDITRLGYEKCKIGEVKKDYKEIDEFLNSRA